MQHENQGHENYGAEKLYGQYDTQEELDSEYNVETAVPDFQQYIRYYQETSEKARSTIPNRRTFNYGPTLMERLTVYPAEKPYSPVLVFIHGGYWRMGIGDDFDFIVTGPIQSGFTVIVITYALAPHVGIPEIIRQVRSSIAWTAKNIQSLNGDPRKLFIAGHSAGAHLAAMASTTHWSDYGLSDDVIKGILAISGLYDLEPVSQTFIQPAIRITAEQILTASPLRLIKPNQTPLTVSWGSLETAEFRNQSDTYLNAWRKAGNLGLSLIIPGADHFSILKEFESVDGQLTQALTDLYNKI